MASLITEPEFEKMTFENKAAVFQLAFEMKEKESVGNECRSTYSSNDQSFSSKIGHISLEEEANSQFSDAIEGECNSSYYSDAMDSSSSKEQFLSDSDSDYLDEESYENAASANTTADDGIQVILNEVTFPEKDKQNTDDQVEGETIPTVAMSADAISAACRPKVNCSVSEAISDDTLDTTDSYITSPSQESAIQEERYSNHGDDACSGTNPKTECDQFYEQALQCAGCTPPYMPPVVYGAEPYGNNQIGQYFVPPMNEPVFMQADQSEPPESPGQQNVAYPYCPYPDCTGFYGYPESPNMGELVPQNISPAATQQTVGNQAQQFQSTVYYSTEGQQMYHFSPMYNQPATQYSAEGQYMPPESNTGFAPNQEFQYDQDAAAVGAGLEDRTSTQPGNVNVQQPVTWTESVEQPTPIGENELANQEQAVPTTAQYPSLCVSEYGVITVLLRSNVSVEMTLDRSVRVVNHDKKLVVATNARGNSSCIIHPAVRAFQINTTTDADVFLARRARLTTENVLIGNNFKTYQFDNNSIFEASPEFNDLSRDLSINYLFSSEFYGAVVVPKCLEVTSAAFFEYYKSGGFCVNINGVKIVQSANDDVSVTCGPKYLRMSPTEHVIRIQTHFVDMDVEANWNIKIRRGAHTVNASHLGFIVSNGRMEASFDDRNLLRACSLPRRIPVPIGPRNQHRPGSVTRRRLCQNPMPEPETDHGAYARSLQSM